MTKEDIIRMAREAGAGEPVSLFGRTDYVVMTRFELERFYQLAVSAEREACAKVCDELQSIPATEPRHCAEDIRARGNT